MGFDIILSEPSRDDPALGMAIKRHGRVVLPAYVDSHFNISYPSKAFSAARIGHIHLEQGIDGIVREVFHRISYRKNSLPSFASSIYDFMTSGTLKATGIPVDSERRHNFGSIFQRVPMVINYYGPPGTYPSISFMDAIEGRWPSSFFEDKIVLVGLTAAGLEDRMLTPFTRERNRMAGVEVHANIINNLLDRSNIKVVDHWVRWPAVLAVSLLGFSMFAGLGGIRATQIWLMGLGAIVFTVFVIFAVFNLWLAPATFCFAVTFVFIMAYIFKLEKMGILLLKAKEDWEESFNTINDAIIIHDSGCKIIRANKTAQENFGSSLLDLLTQRCSRFQDGENRPPDSSIGKKDSETDEDVIDEIFDPKLEKHLEIKSIPRFDENRHFDGMVQIIRDITERVRTEKEQQDLQFQLAQAQKMEAIGTLAGGIAHDFNNILSAIIGYTELASLEIPPGSKAKRQLGEVLKGGERAKELVNQILTFGRQTAHEKKPLQIGLIIKEALKLLRSTIPSTIEIQTDISSKGMVVGDPTQMHQIAMNLCTNAYHAMRERGGVLAVTLKDIDIGLDSQNPALQPGAYVKLSVRDTGKGITPAHLKRIFDPYFTTKKKGEGTGLGLAVVDGIVRTHGGAITVKSDPGVGTRFDIFLPKVDAKIEQEIKNLQPLPKGNERILFVDDEQALVAMVQEMLERLGYEVVIRTSSVEALETFRKGLDEFDLVITDMTMPYMTGENLAVELMQTRSDIPIVLCTGFSEMIDEEKAKAIGIRAFVMKPLVMNELAKTIRKVLDERE